MVRKCRVADASASIFFSLWNEQAAAIEEGDILRLIKGYTIFVSVCFYMNLCVYVYVPMFDVCVCACLGMPLYGKARWFCIVGNMGYWRRLESKCGMVLCVY